ncbi:MAG TPA: guanine deaminase [Bacillota bacterium]|nr:guanine deaminase [Bacillota bacterium]
MFLKGNIAYTPSPEKFEVIESGYLEIVDGLVKGVYKEKPAGVNDADVTDVGDQLIIPGFVDLHLHAPQYANVGLGMDMELMPWLNTYTFPEEAKYKDVSYADKVYSQVVKSLWKNGTTRSVIFGSIHRESTNRLIDMMIEAGLSAYVGKVNIDRNAPDFYMETLEESLSETEQFLKDNVGKSDLVKPIVTPRFVPTCTEELMRGSAELAKKYDVPVQSHLSENLDEMAFVKELHPEFESYGYVYDEFGLFGQQETLMAHSIHLTENEIQLMKERGVWAVHCAHSNANLGSGIMPIRQLLDNGNKVGLGSDVSGGHMMFMPANITLSIQLSRLVWQETNHEQDALSTSEAFYLATKGGGKFFGKVGSFEEGYEADVLVINDDNLGVDGLSLQERVQRFIYVGDDRNVVSRYVRGELLEEPSFDKLVSS